MPLDGALAIDAAYYGAEYKLPLADSIIYATAQKFNALVWTQDADFEPLEGVKYFSKLKRAAEIQGRSVSDFVVSAAQRAAVKTVEQADQERFVAALSESSPLAPAMEQAIRYHEKLVGPFVG